jgi:REP element-mobilizing transposase RayT
MLRQHLQRFGVWLLDYCVTSNHVHLLVDAEERLEVSGLTRNVAGEFARAYNRRKGRCDNSLTGIGSTLRGENRLEKRS